MGIFMKKARSKLSKPANLIFYIGLIALPITQFVLMYIVVNINSFLLAFKDFDGVKYVWTGFSNFSRAFYNLSHEDVLLTSLKNSLLYYVLSLLFGTILSVLFSFYICKNKFLSGFYRIMLFLPSVISGLVIVILFRYFADRAVPFLLKALFNKQFQGLLSDPRYTFTTIIIYNIVIGFGSSLLIYCGSINSISTSIIEAAQIDGITPLKEFVYITLPSIYSVFVTFLVCGIPGIFTNQLNLFSLYGTTANYEYYTFGYYLYSKVYGATAYEYPYLSTLGLIFSCIAVPITLTVKMLLTKYGPSDK